LKNAPDTAQAKEARKLLNPRSKKQIRTVFPKVLRRSFPVRWEDLRVREVIGQYLSNHYYLSLPVERSIYL